MRNFFRKLCIVIVELAVIAGVLLIIAQKKGIKNIRGIVPAAEQAITGKTSTPFPQLLTPVQKTYAWTYKNVKYSVAETLYTSVADYYASQPKTYSYVGTLADNWEDEYYGMFITSNQADTLITTLAQGIAAQGKKHSLSDDQIAELTLAFVQSIPYDDAKARGILTGSKDITMEYPYETLFSESGVCSDKSFLATALLRSLGYGTAIFAYDQQNHMAIGIQCPKQYSTYGSGYCYAETTSTGNKIGIIPSLDATSNKASAVINAANFDLQDDQAQAAKELGEVKIYQRSTGKVYQAIATTLSAQTEMGNLQKEIATLSKKLAANKSALAQDNKTLAGKKNKLEALKKNEDYDAYNAMVPEFNAFVEAYRKKVDAYNKDVTLYNQKVNRYNALLQN